MGCSDVWSERGLLRILAMVHQFDHFVSWPVFWQFPWLFVAVQLSCVYMANFSRFICYFTRIIRDLYLHNWLVNYKRCKKQFFTAWKCSSAPRGWRHNCQRVTHFFSVLGLFIFRRRNKIVITVKNVLENTRGASILERFIEVTCQCWAFHAQFWHGYQVHGEQTIVDLNKRKKVRFQL